MGNQLLLGRTSGKLVLPVTIDADGHLQIDTLSMPSLPAGSNHIGKVEIDTALPAGSNHIGKVEIDTALPAGNNNIGNVDVVTMPSIPAGSDRIGSAGIEGYYGGAWRKAPIPFGASADFGNTLQNLALPAGNSSQDFSIMPINCFLVVTTWAVAYVGTVTNVILTLVRLAGGSTTLNVAQFRGLTSGAYYFYNGFLLCKPTDTLRIVVNGATANDDLYSQITGYIITNNL